MFFISERNELMTLIGTKHNKLHPGKITSNDLQFDEEHPSISILDYDYMQLKKHFTMDAWKLFEAACALTALLISASSIECISCHTICFVFQVINSIHLLLLNFQLQSLLSARTLCQTFITRLL